jgi:hypothetical protein
MADILPKCQENNTIRDRQDDLTEDMADILPQWQKGFEEILERIGRNAYLAAIELKKFNTVNLKSLDLSMHVLLRYRKQYNKIKRIKGRTDAQIPRQL